jgi:hypothetical protein
MEESKVVQIANAKALLEQEGYYTHNLWHIRDVKDVFPNVTEDQAQNILHAALNDQFILECIWYKIKNKK